MVPIEGNERELKKLIFKRIHVVPFIIWHFKMCITFFIIGNSWMKLSQIFLKTRRKLFVTLKHFPYNVPEDQKLYANEKQNCLRPFARLSHTHTHTHTSCYFILFDNLLVSVSWWCNTNRKRSTFLPVHSNNRTARRVKGFDNFWSVAYDATLLLSSVLPTATYDFLKCVELSTKVSYDYFQR
jgi:hypothetical protein